MTPAASAGCARARTAGEAGARQWGNGWAAASNGDRSENGDYIYGKKRLREIDRRGIRSIKRLDVAEVVDPAGVVRRP